MSGRGDDRLTSTPQPGNQEVGLGAKEGLLFFSDQDQCKGFLPPRAAPAPAAARIAGSGDRATNAQADVLSALGAIPADPGQPVRAGTGASEIIEDEVMQVDDGRDHGGEPGVEGKLPQSARGEEKARDRPDAGGKRSGVETELAAGRLRGHSEVAGDPEVLDGVP